MIILLKRLFFLEDFDNLIRPYLTQCESLHLSSQCGICNLSCFIKEDDIGSMIAYALLSQTLWEKMNVLWQEMTGVPADNRHVIISYFYVM